MSDNIEAAKGRLEQALKDAKAKHYAGAVVDVADLEAILASHAGLDDENEQLRLAILGGEDVPGLAASLTLAEVLKAHTDNRSQLIGYGGALAARVGELEGKLGTVLAATTQDANGRFIIDHVDAEWLLTDAAAALPDDAAHPPRGDQVSPPEGWVMVPRDDDARSFSDSLLPRQMIDAGMEVLDRAEEDLAGRNGPDVPDWDTGMEAVAVFRAMLSASPRSPVSAEDKGNHDCLAKRRPGEPMFIFLGRDPDAHNLVRLWSERRLAAGGDVEHCQMGLDTATRMTAYAADPANRPASAPPAEAYPPMVYSTDVERLVKALSDLADDWSGTDYGPYAGANSRAKEDALASAAEDLRAALAPFADPVGGEEETGR